MMRQTRRFGCLLAFALVFAAWPADPVAQSAKLLDKDTFLDMESLGAPAISPDGRQIVFARTWNDKIKDQSRSNLWIVDADGSRVRELTRGSWRDSSPSWAPDSKRIAFMSDRDGTNQLHVMYRRHRRGGAADAAAARTIRTFSGHPTASRSRSRRRFLTRIRFCASSCRSGRAAPNGRAARSSSDRLTWARDGTGPVEKGYTHIFVVDAILGGTPRQITEGKFNHSDPEWSADGQTIYVSALRKPDAEYMRGDSEDLRNRSEEPLRSKTLTDRKGPDNEPDASRPTAS